MKRLKKAIQLGLPVALIIAFGLVLLLIFVPEFINGGTLLLVEENQPLLITEIIMAVGILVYGIHKFRNVIRDN